MRRERMRAHPVARRGAPGASYRVTQHLAAAPPRRAPPRPQVVQAQLVVAARCQGADATARDTQPRRAGGDARHARHARRVRTEYRRVTRAVCVCSLLADDEDNGEDFAPCASSSSSPAFCISRCPQPISVIRVRQPIRRRCALPGSASSEPGPGYRPGNSRFGRLGPVGTPLPVDGRGPRRLLGPSARDSRCTCTAAAARRGNRPAHLAVVDSSQCSRALQGLHVAAIKTAAAVSWCGHRAPGSCPVRDSEKELIPGLETQPLHTACALRFTCLVDFFSLRGRGASSAVPSSR